MFQPLVAAVVVAAVVTSAGGRVMSQRPRGATFRNCTGYSDRGDCFPRILPPAVLPSCVTEDVLAAVDGDVSALSTFAVIGDYGYEIVRGRNAKAHLATSNDIVGI